VKHGVADRWPAFGCLKKLVGVNLEALTLEIGNSIKLFERDVEGRAVMVRVGRKNGAVPWKTDNPPATKVDQSHSGPTSND